MPSLFYFPSFLFIPFFFLFFFNDTATTEIYTLSLHDALPIFDQFPGCRDGEWSSRGSDQRSEEHTSELQSQSNLVCRLLLEKKKKNSIHKYTLRKKQLKIHNTSYTVYD